MYRSVGLTISVSIVMSAFGACARPQRVEYRGTRAATPPTRHAVEAERLREIMLILERERRTTWPQEIEDVYSKQAVVKREEALADARHVAATLAEAAMQIPEAVATVDMPEVDRRAFLAQVETLRDQAQRLKGVAEGGDIAAMDRALADIDDTCQSCHYRFRDYAGPLDR